MHTSGALEKLSRGLYRLTEFPRLNNPDLVSIAARVPDSVVCLISALAFHEITSQVPHEVYIAIPRGTEPPRLAYPPTRIFWFDRRAFTAGIEKHKLDGIPVRVYGPEKTIADCFKYRNKIGLDTALEALKLYREKKPLRVNELMKYATICRVQRIIRPYLEALL